MTLDQVLHEAGSPDQRTGTWCPIGTALRRRKAGPVLLEAVAGHRDKSPTPFG